VNGQTRVANVETLSRPLCHQHRISTLLTRPRHPERLQQITDSFVHNVSHGHPGQTSLSAARERSRVHFTFTGSGTLITLLCVRAVTKNGRDKHSSRLIPREDLNADAEETTSDT